MRQYTPLSVTVPANTVASSPVSQSWRLYPGIVHTFRIDIPAAHSGLTGIRLVYQGTPIVPFDLSQYIQLPGQTFTIPYEDQIMDRGLVAQAFNTDVYPHTFYLWADVDPRIPGQPPPGFIPRNQFLTSVGNALDVGALRNLGALPV